MKQEIKMLLPVFFDFSRQAEGGLIMASETKYSIGKKIEYNPLELIDIPELINGCREKWLNLSLCRVNDCLVRLGVIQGEFHWHKHNREDEFFYVIDGRLYIDLKDRTVELTSKQGFMVPKGISHRTRAPERTAILVVDGSTITTTGD
jgi:mannose-6-phosphate isomerase-like protein (cupin superfamily)